MYNRRNCDKNLELSDINDKSLSYEEHIKSAVASGVLRGDQLSGASRSLGRGVAWQVGRSDC